MITDRQAGGWRGAEEVGEAIGQAGAPPLEFFRGWGGGLILRCVGLILARIVDYMIV